MWLYTEGMKMDLAHTYMNAADGSRDSEDERG